MLNTWKRASVTTDNITHMSWHYLKLLPSYGVTYLSLACWFFSPARANLSLSAPTGWVRYMQWFKEGRQGMMAVYYGYSVSCCMPVSCQVSGQLPGQFWAGVINAVQSHFTRSQIGAFQATEIITIDLLRRHWFNFSESSDFSCHTLIQKGHYYIKLVIFCGPKYQLIYCHQIILLPHPLIGHR